MFYDKFKELCEKKGISCTKAALEIGLSNSTATKWKNTGATPDYETMRKVAEYFDVATAQLSWDDFYPMVKCWECGDYYNSAKSSDVSAHEERHAKWKAAVDKFGFCWTVSYREEVKASARNAINCSNLSTSEHISKQLIVFKSLFSRSLEASDYDLKHVDFPTYVSMLLHQDFWKKKIPEDVYSEMVNEFGTRPGIPNKETYYKNDEHELIGSELKKSTPKTSVDGLSDLERNLLDDFRLLNRQGKEIVMQTLDMAVRLYSGDEDNSSCLEKVD